MPGIKIKTKKGGGRHSRIEMRITNVALAKPNVYQVTFSPNWLECLLNYGPKKKLYFETGATFTFGGGSVFVDQEGNKVDNGHRIQVAIDRFILKQQIQKTFGNVTINSN